MQAIIAALALLASATTAAAQTVQNPTASTPKSYSATAVHGLPGQPETTGKIVKSGQNMRLEYDQNGETIIQILRPTEGLMYILDPKAQTYTEIRGQAVPATATDGYTTPCPKPAALARCERTGTDTVSGIKVERWELSTGTDTKPVVMLWDSTRRRALHQIFPDGSVMALRFKEMVPVNGRNTEHWSIKITAPDQPANTGSWWFDPDLRVVVREELPGGEIRRLDDITVGPVDPDLFQVPEGWKNRNATGPANE